MATKIILPHLQPWQMDVYSDAKDAEGSGKVFVVKAKRQIGKSILAVCLLITYALRKRCTSICIEPTLAQSRRIFRQVCDFLNGSGAIIGANAQLLEIQFVNGSEILFRSAEQRESLRGYSVSGLLVIDEAAYIDDEIFQMVYPMVDAKSSPVLLISTPLFMSGEFYRLYMSGLEQNTNVKSYDWSTYDTSIFLPKEKLEYYRQTVSRAVFTTEYEGNFIADGMGLLFQGINDVIISKAGDGPVVYCGIDFGTGSEKDYTVLSVIDSRGNMVEIHRTNNLTPTQQVDWLCGLLIDLKSRREIKTILCEWNSIGSVYIDMMKKRLIGYPIQNWVTTNKSKGDLVTNLQIAIENGYIHLLNEPHLLNELLHYQADINVKTKVVTYNGANGYNDDTVIATMLAYYAYKKGMGNFSISFA